MFKETSQSLCYKTKRKCDKLCYLYTKDYTLGEKWGAGLVGNGELAWWEMVGNGELNTQSEKVKLISCLFVFVFVTIYPMQLLRC